MLEYDCMKKGRIFIISGPSGVGKGTVIDEILKDRKLNLQRGMNITTRKPRKSDRNNPHYIFVNKRTFEKMEEKKLFLERNEYSGEYYGTSKLVIDKVLSVGGNVLLEADVNGALTIKKKIPEAVLIFIYCRIKDLEKRLKSRGDVLKKERVKRLKRAREELKLKNKYDYNVLNPEGHPEEAILKIKRIIGKEIKK